VARFYGPRCRKNIGSSHAVTEACGLVINEQ